MIQNTDEELEAERQEKIKKLKTPEPTGNLRKCNCNRQEKRYSGVLLLLSQRSGRKHYQPKRCGW